MSMFVILAEMTPDVTEAGTEKETGGEIGPGHVTERDAADLETGDAIEAETDAGVAAETGREARDHAVAVVTEKGDVRRERRENLMTGSVSRRSQLTPATMISMMSIRVSMSNRRKLRMKMVVGMKNMTLDIRH